MLTKQQRNVQIAATVLAVELDDMDAADPSEVEPAWLEEQRTEEEDRRMEAEEDRVMAEYWISVETDDCWADYWREWNGPLSRIHQIIDEEEEMWWFLRFNRSEAKERECDSAWAWHWEGDYSPLLAAA